MPKLSPSNPRFFSAKAKKQPAPTQETVPFIGGIKQAAARLILEELYKSARIQKSLSLKNTSARASAHMSLPEDPAQDYQGLVGTKTLLKRMK